MSVYMKNDVIINGIVMHRISLNYFAKKLIDSYGKLFITILTKMLKVLNMSLILIIIFHKHLFHTFDFLSPEMQIFFFNDKWGCLCYLHFYFR